MRIPAQFAGVDRRPGSLRAAEMRNGAILDVIVESTSWPRWPETVEAEVRQSLEAHAGVVADLIDLLKGVA